MPGLSTDRRNEVLDMYLLQTAPTVPAGAFLLISMQDPQNDGTGIVEPSGASYLRVNLAGMFPAAADGESANTGLIAFPEAAEDWGIATHVAVMDTATIGGGAMLMSGPLAQPKFIGKGDVLRFRPAHLVAVLTDNELS